MTGIEVGLIGTALATGVSAVGSIAAGASANKQAKAQAKVLEQQAEQERAAANREAVRKREEADVIGSRQVAAAAASGGGVNDPTVLKIMGDTAGEGEIQAKEIQYGGDVRATDLENQAAMVKYSGKQAKTAGLIKGITTIASGASSMYSKLNPADGGGGFYGGSGAQRFQPDEFGNPRRYRYG